MTTLNIGCALWTLGPTPDVDTLKRHMAAVAEIGCTSVQPWAINHEYTPCILDPEVGSGKDRQAAIRAAEELGITFSGFCCQLQGPRGYGGLECEDGLEERIRRTKVSLSVSVDLGGEGIPVSTHVGHIPDDPTHPDYAILLRSVSAIAAHAERIGATFCPETGQESATTLKRFIEDIGSPNVKVNFDPCNLMRFGSADGVIEGVHILKGLIVHTHAKDWNPETRRATCGEGTVPWDRYIEALKQIGYNGVCAIEDESGVHDMLGSIRKSFEFLSRY
ncbi:MAG: sugar phosphate isomerase/epimerase [Anaerolineae bacterium]|nr:sugar phosphate isomerase/epimerase [Anaerolineae bacterium]